MYTATLIGDTKNIELRRRMVNVEFTNGTHTFNKEFQFRIDETLEIMKRAVKSYLDELNFTPPEIADLEPAPEAAPEEPTADELARTAWEADFAKIKKAQELLDCGVAFSAGQLSALATLRGKVATNFKAEYLS